MADFGADVELETFRGEARAWLEANFPASLRGKAGEAMNLMEGGTPAGDLAAWRKRLADKGWTTPTWPTHSGPALSTVTVTSSPRAFHSSSSAAYTNCSGERPP